MRGSSIHLFKLWGVDVYLHFSWFLVAIFQFTSRSHGYSSPIFAVYEYLALFVIVLMHEFGHAMACRQTGGFADRIMLWPLGGIAFVQPPERPGAQLWSIAAGPLVNVVLLPVLMIVQFVAGSAGLPFRSPDMYRLIVMIAWINGALLFFNLLPIYPLDGGQILRSLLWFPFGRIRSLQVASGIGFAGCLLAGLYAFYIRSFWIGLLALFLISQAVRGWQYARALAQAETAARLAPQEAERPPVL